MSISIQECIDFTRSSDYLELFRELKDTIPLKGKCFCVLFLTLFEFYGKNGEKKISVLMKRLKIKTKRTFLKYIMLCAESKYIKYKLLDNDKICIEFLFLKDKRVIKLYKKLEDSLRNKGLLNGKTYEFSLIQ